MLAFRRIRRVCGSGPRSAYYHDIARGVRTSALPTLLGGAVQDSAADGEHYGERADDDR